LREDLDKKIAALDDLASKKRNAVIFLHDNPDPDAIASGWALHHFFKKRYNLHSIITYGGLIARAENASMVKFLKIPLTPFSEVNINSSDLIALVDTQPRIGNNSLPRKVVPHVVVDHHPRRMKMRVAFEDIKTEYGASVTILYEYFMHTKIEIPHLLATAIFYALSAETQDLGREASDSDQKAYMELFKVANKKILSNISHPRYNREYYTILVRGLKKALISKHISVAHLGDVPFPDYIHQIADILLTCENVRWSLCSGWYRNVLYMSLRASNPRAKAGILVRKLIGSMGKAGGHDMMAGGKLEYLGDINPEMRIDIEGLITKRFALYCGRDRNPVFQRLMIE
jgi:nanoRNase/pAp phosphatase (c-di-AMP/oligoRNAs hydrolase)